MYLCGKFARICRTLDEIRRSGVVRFAFTKSGRQTINRDFAEAFATFLNCSPEYVEIEWDEIFSHNGVVPADYITNDSVYYTPDALLKADIICGTTYIYDWREKFFDFAGEMQVSDLLIVSKYRQQQSVINQFFVPERMRPKTQKLRVKNYRDLKGLKIALMGNSSYERNMQIINDMIGGGITIVKTRSEEESQELARLLLRTTTKNSLSRSLSQNPTVWHGLLPKATRPSAKKSTISS